MKITLLFLLLGSGLARAQGNQAIQTVRIKTSITLCPVCKTLLQDYLRQEEGITYININAHNQIVTVRYWAQRTNPENIRVAIANAGYDADTVTANPDSYAELPLCCKKHPTKP